MWFSGLRGAIAYALSLHLEFATETRRVLVTTTLVIVLFTILILGGSTMPLLKCLRGFFYAALSGVLLFIFTNTLFPSTAKKPVRNRLRRNAAGVSLSKTLKLDQPLESDVVSDQTEDELGLDGSLLQESQHNATPEAISGFIRFDQQYLFPLFTHRFSRAELRENRLQLANLANQWHQAVRSSPGMPATDNDEENNNAE